MEEIWQRRFLSRALIINTLIYGFLLVLIMGAYHNTMIDVNTAFVGVTLVIVIYQLILIAKFRKIEPGRWFLMPVVLCSFFGFIQGYGIGNLAYLLPQEYFEGINVVSGTATPAMVRLVLNAFIGSVGLFFGYMSLSSTKVQNWSIIKKITASFLRPPDAPLRLQALILFFAVTVLVRLLMIKLGVYGYSADEEKVEGQLGYVQYLSVISGLGNFILLITAMVRYTSGPHQPIAAKVLPFVVGAQVFMGLLSGFKSQVAMPFVTLALALFLMRRKISVPLIVAGLISIQIAFAVIQPFRTARMGHKDFSGTSVSEIVDTMLYAQTNYHEDHNDLAWILRGNMTYDGAPGLDYADSPFRELYKAHEPDFLGNILLSPVSSFIPRALWPDKPKTGELGKWYTWYVFGKFGSVSSTAMGPITYLYLGGGTFAVFCVLFLIGMLQKIVFATFMPMTLSITPKFVGYLFIMPFITFLDSNVANLFTSISRGFLIALLIQFLIFGKAVIKKPA